VSTAVDHRPTGATASAGRSPGAILHNAAMDLWDLATEQDAAQMWEEARAIASRILAACSTAYLPGATSPRQLSKSLPTFGATKN